MKRRITGQFPIRGFRLTMACLIAAVALGAAGCEQALQTAPSSSVLTLTTQATSVDLNGSLTVVATVTSSDGKAVADGTLVSFSTTLGRLEPTEARVGNGRASVQLVAGSVAGVATVSATSGSIAAAPLSIRIGPVPSRVVMSVSAGALGAASVVATVFDQKGLAVPGVPVLFTASAGTLSSNAVYTDQLGQAFTTLFAVTDSVVTADALGVKSTIAVRPGASGTIAVNITMAPTLPTRNQTVVFTAVVPTVSGGGVIPIERYEWDWGNGFVVITTGNTTSRAFSSEGAYALTVRAVGVGGAVGIAYYQFYVD